MRRTKRANIVPLHSNSSIVSLLSLDSIESHNRQIRPLAEGAFLDNQIEGIVQRPVPLSSSSSGRVGPYPTLEEKSRNGRVPTDKVPRQHTECEDQEEFAVVAF